MLWGWIILIPLSDRREYDNKNAKKEVNKQTNKNKQTNFTFNDVILYNSK